MKMWISILMLTISSAFAIIDINPIQTNGLLFEEEGNVYIVEEIWKVFTKMPIKEYLMEPIKLQARIDQLKLIQEMLKEKNDIENIDMLIDEIQKLINSIEQLNSVLNIKRDKRDAFFPLIGKGIELFFGNPDEEAMNEVIFKLNDLERSNLNTQMLLSNNTMLTIKLIENMEARYNHTQTQFETLVSEIEKNMLKVDSEARSKEIIINTQILILAVIRYNALQNKIIKYLTSNDVLYVDPELFPVSSLGPILSEIQENIDSTRTLPYIHKNEKILWYKIIPMKVVVTNEQIIFELTIPIVSRTKKQLYAVFSAPKIENNSLVYIEPQAPFIVTNEIKNEIGYVSQSEIDSCIKIREDHLLCTTSFAIYNRHTNNNYCELITLLNANETSHNCAIKTVPKRNMIFKIRNTNQYYFVAVENILAKAQCGKQVNNIVLNETGIITVSNGCILYNQNFRISSKSTNTITRTVHFQASQFLPIKSDNKDQYKIVTSNEELKALNKDYEIIKEKAKNIEIIEKIEVETSKQKINLNQWKGANNIFLELLKEIGISVIIVILIFVCFKKLCL